MTSPQIGSVVRYSVGEKTAAGTYTSPMASASEFHRCGASMNNRSAWCYIDSDGDPHLVITNFQTGNEISDTVLDLTTTHNFRTDYHTVRFGNMLAIAFSTTDSSVVVYEVSVNDGGATVAVEGSFEITQGSTFGTHVCFVEDRGTIFCISTANGSPTNEVFVFPCYMQGVVQSTMAVTEMVIECTLNADTDSIYAINSQTEPANFIFINGDVASYCISIVSQGLATAVTVLSGLQNIFYYKANDDRYQETNTVTPLALSDDYVCAPNTLYGAYYVKPIMHSRPNGLIYVIDQEGINSLYIDRGTRRVRELSSIYSDSTLSAPTLLTAYEDNDYLFVEVQEAALNGITFQTLSYDLADETLSIVSTNEKLFTNSSAELAENVIHTSPSGVTAVGTGSDYVAFTSNEKPSFVSGDEYVEALAQDVVDISLGGYEPLTHWAETKGSTGVNSTVNVSVFKPNVASANADAAIEPKGSGASLAQTPDGTATGGNKRGAYAVDFQRDRSSSDMVASGDYSSIPFGKNNKASSDFSTASGNGALANAIGMMAFSPFMFSSEHGSNQFERYSLGRVTTDNTASFMTLDGNAAGADNLIPMEEGDVFTFLCLSHGVDVATGDTVSKCFVGYTQMITSPTCTGDFVEIFSFATGSFTADTSVDVFNDTLYVSATGEAATTIRWSSTVLGIRTKT